MPDVVSLVSALVAFRFRGCVGSCNCFVEALPPHPLLHVQSPLPSVQSLTLADELVAPLR